MMNFPDDPIKEIVPILKMGGVGVLSTDTIYGLVGGALSKKTVERIYVLRKRNPKKPLIILIGSLRDLELFSIKLSNEQKKTLKGLWPGKVSVVLPCKLKKFTYLHRGTETLAFRLPDDEMLKKLLKKTGPLVVPSANFEGEKPAVTIREAKKYFKDDVDFYVDAGKLKSKPSTLVRFDGNSEVEVLRQGAVKIK
ncbi:MAG TPA: L-threonylcarbamoyladenylate synthase [Patescibacteria group bacterium]